MHTVTALVLAAALSPAIVAQVTVAEADPLDDAKGKARPVVVLSDSRDDSRVAKQIQALDGTGPDLGNRNIQVLQEADAYGPLHRKLGVGKKGFSVVLLGKDGTVKKVWREPVDPKAIFTIIDAMPMRRTEMKG